MSGRLTSHGLVERETDIDHVRAAIGRARSGEGSLVFVEGPAGIGKTGVLAASAQLAAQSGMRVLRARGSELERDFSYGVVRQLLEREVLGLSPAERERVLAGPARNAAESTLSDEPTAEPAHAGGEFAAMHGLFWLTANLAAERPLLLVIDDAHWADVASLRFAHYLSHRMEGLALLMLAAIRPDDPSLDPDLLERLLADAASTLHLAALSANGSAEIVRARMTAGDAFLRACHESTGGNPFLLHELLSAVAADAIGGDEEGARLVRRLTPKKVSRAVLLRLSRLPAGAIELARAAAILGEDAELADAAALAGVPLADAAALADALAVAGVLAAGLPLRFTHPVILEAVAGDLGAAERAAMHAQAAALLHARTASAEQIAAQLASSPPFGEPWAADVLRRAARAAMSRAASDSAVRHLRRALREEHTPASRAAVLAELGAAECVSGDESAAIDHLREACELPLESSSLRRQTTLLLADAMFYASGHAVPEIALGALEGPYEFDRRDRLLLEAGLATHAMLNLSLMPRFPERLERFRDLPGSDPEELSVLGMVAMLTWFLGTAEQAAALAWRALADGRLLATVSSDSGMFIQAVAALLHSDRLDEARVVCEAGLDDARARGSLVGFVTSSMLAAMRAFRAGDIAECEGHMRAALELREMPAAIRPRIHAQLAFALTERGELDAAEAALDAAGIGPQLPVTPHLTGGFYARALLRVAQGRDEDALADLREFGRRDEACMVRNVSMPWRVDAARACMRLERLDEARELLDEHELRAQRWGTPAGIGAALAARAAMATGPEQVALLQEAEELLEQSPRRLEHGRVQLELGIALRRNGQRREAERLLAKTVSLARACGATALAVRANDELGVLTARPRRLQFSGAESLTASERRVALMAAEGLPSARIAQSLFVTVKTVENHLGRVYIKLAINSRGQLAAALGLSGAADEAVTVRP